MGKKMGKKIMKLSVKMQNCLKVVLWVIKAWLK